MLSCFLALVDSCSGYYQCSSVRCAPMKIILPWRADNAWLISHVINGFTSKYTLNQSGNWSSPCDLKGSWRNMQRLQQLPLQDALARNPMTLREPCGNRAGKERWFTEFTACYWMAISDFPPQAADFTPFLLFYCNYKSFTWFKKVFCIILLKLLAYFSVKKSCFCLI